MEELDALADECLASGLVDLVWLYSKVVEEIVGDVMHDLSFCRCDSYWVVVGGSTLLNHRG